ncbi:carbonic anhydrase [Heliophilum fasciatum]|nr:carbonic anhydrase [Heliophilum fasciatum]MCW2276987.1 carbonic anhydrase [Heliophilum fasciatum]
MATIAGVNQIEDIYPHYQETPIGRLLEYHNLNRPFDRYVEAQLLVGMCMDNRKQLHIPDNFAYILRTGGGNLRSSEFKVSYAIGVGRVRAIALIAHNHCGMVHLMTKKDDFIQGLVDIGWDATMAADHFNSFASMFEIGNEVDFVLSEAGRLRARYPGVLVAPMLYRLEDNRLYLLGQ